MPYLLHIERTRTNKIVGVISMDLNNGNYLESKQQSSCEYEVTWTMNYN